MDGEEVGDGDVFSRLARDARDLFIPGTCPVYEAPPSALVFYREQRWGSEGYLRDLLGSMEISVEVTPNGRGDALHDGVFVLPQTQRMRFREVLDILAKPQAGAVHYVSHQNGSLTDPDEFAGVLLKDIEHDLAFAREAFDMPPDAINFWMGPKEAVTSLHKDPYENIYCVITGEKIFTLYPPVDFPFLYEKDYPCAEYVQREDKSGFDVRRIEPPSDPEAPYDPSHRPWLSVDPDNPDYERYPRFREATPLRVCVKAGEVLYLPSMWFHHVAQRPAEGEPEHSPCIAVNMWYDMKYDLRYSYFSFMENVLREKNTGLES